MAVLMAIQIVPNRPSLLFQVLFEASAQEEIKIISLTDVYEETREVVETLTTIVEIEEGKEEVKCKVEDDEKESTVMRALSQLSQLMGEIGEPKQELIVTSLTQEKENIKYDAQALFYNIVIGVIMMV